MLLFSGWSNKINLLKLKSLQLVSDIILNGNLMYKQEKYEQLSTSWCFPHHASALLGVGKCDLGCWHVKVLYWVWTDVNKAAALPGGVTPAGPQITRSAAGLGISWWGEALEVFFHSQLGLWPKLHFLETRLGRTFLLNAVSTLNRIYHPVREGLKKKPLNL